MKQSVTLKGSKDGFVLTLNESASFTAIVEELEQLLEHLKTESKKDDSNEKNKKIQLEVITGNRLLTDEEKKVLTKMIKENSHFEIKKISSAVLTYESALAWQQAVSLQMEIQTVRSGQVLQAPGDILFVGKVHPGGVIRANGSIFIIGELHGVAHAGFEGDAAAVIVADFHTNAQVRIADNVQIIENQSAEKLSVKKNEFAFINDLHILDFENLDHLSKMRPMLGKLTGGLI
ncbi:septum site-determining protein MinC [Carnobacterium funditum]|uniref:septum site-determining protein MinC n=1 Tax=Carnobacterium funditum TaxID=2752 RepID=UPI00054F172D|nr:septum site-determining protein MinC [Carnobacterium funditum]